MNTNDFICYSSYYREAEEPLPSPIHLGFGMTAETAYKQPPRTGASHVNDETAIVRRFLIDAGVLSVDDDAM